MKIRPLISLLCLIAVLGATGFGCSTLFEKKQPAMSLPVLSGAASTNDVQSVAWLRYAQLLNRETPSGPTQPMIDALLGSAITIASGVAGWTARHASGKEPPKPTV